MLRRAEHNREHNNVRKSFRSVHLSDRQLLDDVFAKCSINFLIDSNCRARSSLTLTLTSFSLPLFLFLLFAPSYSLALQQDIICLNHLEYLTGNSYACWPNADPFVNVFKAKLWYSTSNVLSLSLSLSFSPSSVIPFALLGAQFQLLLRVLIALKWVFL